MSTISPQPKEGDIMSYDRWKFTHYFFMFVFVAGITILSFKAKQQYDDHHDQEFVVIENPNVQAKAGFDLKKEASKIGTVTEKITGLNGYRVMSDNNRVQSMALDASVTVEPVIKFSKPKPVSNDAAFSFGCGRKPKPKPTPAPTPTPTPKPTPNTQVYDWGVKRVNGMGTKGTEKIKVCMLDTGIDRDHPDLKYLSGRNFTTSDTTDFQDRDGHGSHTAGLVAAVDNNIGVVGASHAQLLIGKVLGDDGSGYNDWIAAGINWCVTEKANIISMSLGGPSPSTAILNALKKASSAGILIFAAAGNDGSKNVGYPAGYTLTNLFSISALDSDDTLAYFSNYGKVEFACPGVDIYSTVIDSYDTYSGTSMATPLCAGVAAHFLANGKKLEAQSLGDKLKFGAGILVIK